ncbi:MAG: VCBS repeat-containing protein [Bacteroidota bacterium]
MNFHPLRKTKTIRQFRALSKKLGMMVDNGSFFQLTKEKQQSLRQRLARLYRQVGATFSRPRLRRTLASAALLLGLAGGMQAQTFAPPVSMPFNLTTDEFPIYHFADIDNDGDPDAFFTFYGEDGDRILGYQENMGTPQVANFDTVQINPFGISAPDMLTTVDLADVDKDGDLDLFVGTYDFGSQTPILGWENTGTAEAPSWVGPAENPLELDPSPGIAEVAFVDIDGDSDLDVFMNNYVNDDDPEGFRFQENTGIPPGSNYPDYGMVQIDPFGLSNDSLTRIVMDFADLDMDGDQDLLAGGVTYASNYNYATTNFYYFENTGTATSPAFAPYAFDPFDLQIPPETYVLIPTLVDLDSDGDTDIVASTYNEDTEEVRVFYWENLGNSTNTEDITAIAQISVFPTLAEEAINWEIDMEETLQNNRLQIIDLYGQVSYSENLDLLVGDNKGVISTDQLASGMYVLYLSNAQGETLANRRFFVK